MKRLKTTPRANFAQRLEASGLSFHGWDNYWKEDVCYRFTLAQIEEIEAVTEELHLMCVNAVKVIIGRNRLGDMGIPEAFWTPIKTSFESNDFSVYGRFDLAYDGVSPPKMLEYNADTPTSLLESAVAQWEWLEDKFPEQDQFNSLHEKLIERWKNLPGTGPVYLASLAENEEDWVCSTYMLDTIAQAGREARHLFVEDIGWDNEKGIFVDLDNNPIDTLFKLYPWEWMVREEFGANILKSQTRFVEPMWKAVLSCKAILPILWELYPDHPNLLEAHFTQNKLTSYAKKPLYSREGANIVLKDGKSTVQSEGQYGAEGYIYQALHKLSAFDGRYPVIGSWIVGEQAAGMCIREDDSPITTNMSNFVPHYFTEN